MLRKSAFLAIALLILLTLFSCTNPTKGTIVVKNSLSYDFTVHAGDYNPINFPDSTSAAEKLCPPGSDIVFLPPQDVSFNIWLTWESDTTLYYSILTTNYDLADF